MTKRARTILFFICALLFLIIAPTIVLYSMGYRFDFDSKKIVATGAFYLKVWPKKAEIYLGSKQKKKTDFFFGSAYIDNLLPKKYEIEVRKKGFHLWRKTLEIEEGRVTELKNIYLIPKDLSFVNAVNNIDNFWLAPDGKSVILKEINENGWNLKIFKLEDNLKIHLLAEKDFEAKEQIELSNLEFSPDSSKILIEIKKEAEKENFIMKIEEVPSDLIPLDSLGKDIKKISFHPREDDKILFYDKNSLFETSFSTKTVREILKDLITYETSEQGIYFLSEDGHLFWFNFNEERKEKLNSESFDIKKETNYQINVIAENVFLLEGDTLYIFDKESERFEKIFYKIKSFEISPDNKKIFLASTHEIWVLFLEEIQDQPPKEKGEKLFLNRFSEEINKVFWYNSHYLIFNAGNAVKVTEIDNRDKINIVDLVDFPEPKISLNRVDKKLYVLSEANLFVSELLLP